MSKKYHITKQGLQSIINAVEQNKDQFFWMTTPTFDKQLHISPQFENIWDCKTETLFNHPQSWMETIVNEKDQQINKKLTRRTLSLRDEDREGTIIMRIRRPDGQLRYIRDSSFCLYDSTGKLTAMAGIGQAITHDEWCHDLEAEVHDASLTKKYVDDGLVLPTDVDNSSFPEVQVLCKKLGKKYLVMTVMGEIIFTQRELDCLKLYLLGLTAKQSARKLDISFRTVEIFMEKVKDKLLCDSKNDIRSKVMYMVR